MGSTDHWNTVYGKRPTEELGWYEPEPSTLGLISTHSKPHDSVIDVGGGDSRLVDGLLDLGYNDLTVLDLSDVAIERAKDRLGPRSKSVNWVHTNLADFSPNRTWNLWHDRAVFHFQTSENQRAAYLATALRCIAPAGLLIVAAFGIDGPKKCAGLSVCCYDVDSLLAVFTPAFKLVTVGPITPVRANEGDQRPYIAAVFTRSIGMP